MNTVCFGTFTIYVAITNATQFHVSIQLYISANTSLDVSKFGVPDLHTRTIQAWLYEDAMKRTLTVEEMEVFKEYLDTDIKIVFSTRCNDHCLWKAKKFESNFYDCRNQGTSLTSKINRFVQLIRMGHCACEACRHAIEKYNIVKGNIERENIEKNNMEKIEDDKIEKSIIEKGSIEKDSIEKGEIEKDIESSIENTSTCIEKGNIDKIEKEIEKETYVCGLSLLHCLMISDTNLYLIAFLSEIGCDMNRPTLLFENRPLTLAVKDKQIEIVKYFVKHFDKPDFQLDFQMALHYAVITEEPCEDIIDALLSAKWIDADYIITIKMERLLMKVLKKPGPDWYMYKVLRLLLKGGADPNQPDLKHCPPLFYCISYNSAKLVELFLEFGAKVDEIGLWVSGTASLDEPITTNALIEAARKDQFDICRILLESGADPNFTTCPIYDSPLSLAIKNRSIALMKLLIRYGANLVRAYDRVSNTFVHDAVFEGHLETLNTLLYACAPHDEVDLDGNTPLMLTALYEQPYYLMKALLDHESGCKVNHANHELDTALHFAAFLNLPNEVTLLIDYGADLNLRNRASATPLWNAVHQGASDVVHGLLDANVEMEVMGKGRDPQDADLNVTVEGFYYSQLRSPLYVALDKGYTDIVLLLKAAGYDIRKETWIQTEPIPNEDQYASFIVDWIVSSKSPMSLETLCKIKLRKNLASEPNHDIYDKVERLEIPLHLKDCLLLKYFREPLQKL